jgi:Raf kinase inhibitor-like YbhB/YbcL family protein
MRKFIFLFIIVAIGLSSCGANPPDTIAPEEGGQTMTFEITSPAFAQGETIPVTYTCDGQDISPPLQWSDPPAGTQSLALIADDPDAPVGTWDHWILFNLPADTHELPEQATPPGGSQEGQNSWGRTGYGGPCPPSGTHRYFFKLYALDTILDLSAGANKDQLLKTMAGHILAQVEIMGTYSRQK